ncbi:MAG: nicotinate-nicotinamide nucleotide adenylyltransferase, partial [Acidobacteriota bacterium]|nr:nicotinate-nicotinamide nucleotide adenylyltransferase [Acidobacteriota bacterium]
MNARRLGLFGGTFDPPHVGHVAALRSVARTGRFSEIEVTVAG